MGVEEVLLFGNSRVLVFIMLAVLAPFFSTWLVTSRKARRAIAVAETTPPGLRRAPTLPYAVPFFGHLIQFMWNGHSLLWNAANYCGRGVPVRIIIPGFPNYVLSGPENVVAYFKESRDLSTTLRGIVMVQRIFGCPGHLLHIYEPKKPEIKSMSPPGEDIESLIHRSTNISLSGAHLDGLAARFQKFLIKQVENSESEIGSDWTAYPDLISFAEKQIFEAAICSMFGTSILSVNPTFADDFWSHSRSIGTLILGLPRWLSPAACRTRDKMLENVKRWHKYVDENCDIATLGDVDWEPYYGSKFSRERQEVLTKRGLTDETAKAAEIFAYIWASNANSLRAAVWFLLETLLDPALKSRVYAALPAASLIPSPDNNPNGSIPFFDHVKLCSDPLLQSMFAETVRLRVAVWFSREPARDNYSFRGWSFKKTEILTLSNTTEAMDPEIWGTGSDENSHPLDTFWADRFLVNPQDPSSGPLKRPMEKKKTRLPRPNVTSTSRRNHHQDAIVDDTDETANAEPSYFSIDGLSTSWIPFGGGSHLCPGRHFAKQEMIITTAVLLSAYDIELVEEKGKKPPQVDRRYFGHGTMPPDRKIPFRIRRRKV